MPIGLAIGGAVAAVGSAVISSGATRSAANTTAAAADRSAAVVQRNYDLTSAATQPWQQGGLRAFNQINDMLGIGAPAQPAGGQIGTGFGGTGIGGTGGNGNWNPSMGGLPPGSPAYGWFGNGSGSPTGPGGGPNGGFGIPATPNTATATPATAANPGDGFRRYIENSDYAFKEREGFNAVNSGYAGRGAVKSGAAIRGIEDYRQDLQQGYRGEYMGALGNQQSLGLTAVQAQAGVGGSAANSLAQIYQNQGQNQAALTAANAQNTNNALMFAVNNASRAFGAN